MFRAYRKLCSSKILTSQEFMEKRNKYEKLEQLYSAIIDPSIMTEEEKAIEEAHKQAIKRYHFTYVDPVGGGKVYTRYFHFLNGKCCGQACRHCTFNMERVPETIRKTKVFNTSFWRDSPEESEEKINREVNKLKELIRVKAKETSVNDKRNDITKVTRLEIKSATSA